MLMSLENPGLDGPVIWDYCTWQFHKWCCAKKWRLDHSWLQTLPELHPMIAGMYTLNGDSMGVGRSWERKSQSRLSSHVNDWNPILWALFYYYAIPAAALLISGSLNHALQLSKPFFLISHPSNAMIYHNLIPNWACQWFCCILMDGTMTERQRDRVKFC